MNRLVTLMAMALLALTAAPPRVAAQVYPERMSIAIKARTVAETGRAYQRRSREDEREEQTERTTRVIKLGADGALALGNIAGDITVTRVNGTEATVEIVKTARGRSVEDAKEMLRLVPVEVTERNGRAEVRTRYPNNDQQRGNRRNFNVSVAYIVGAPAGTRLSVDSISGTIAVSDITGDLNANSVSGDVRISGAGRIGSAKSISGTIDISDTQTDGAVGGSSVSGDVAFRRVIARRMDGSSVSGNIRVEDAQSERVSAQTTSGNVWFGGALARSGRYELKTFSGDVRVLLSGNTGFEVEAKSYSGEVRAELPLQRRGDAESGRRGPRRTLSGTYGDGAAVLDLTTFSGNIVVGKK